MFPLCIHHIQKSQDALLGMDKPSTPKTLLSRGWGTSTKLTPPPRLNGVQTHASSWVLPTYFSSSTAGNQGQRMNQRKMPFPTAASPQRQHPPGTSSPNSFCCSFVITFILFIRVLFLSFRFSGWLTISPQPRPSMSPCSMLPPPQPPLLGKQASWLTCRLVASHHFAGQRWQ